MPKKQDQESTAFKNWIDRKLLVRMAGAIQEVYSSFHSQNFIALAPKLEPLELKARVRLIRDELHRLLPKEYPKALAILLRSLESKALDGFDLWPYTEFVQVYGIDDLERSLPALEKMTSIFTAEFAVRPFLARYPSETLDYLRERVAHESVHVRRWVSEGSRPLLPWGERLDRFVKNPAETLALLERLKHDEELYVRKSVSNHLNDISKHHPEKVVSVLKRWKKEAGETHSQKIDWILNRSLRTLVKAGHIGALSAIGVAPPQIKISGLHLKSNAVRIGGKLDFTFKITSLGKKSQKVVVDYVMHFRKSNGGTSPKVFKLKTFVLEAGESRTITKSHSLKKITTRKYYPGEQWIEIQVSGKSFAKAKWSLRT